MQFQFEDTCIQGPQLEKTQELKGIQSFQPTINTSQNENNNKSQQVQNNSLEQNYQQIKQHSQNQDVTIKRQYLHCNKDKLSEEIENENKESILNQNKIINNEEMLLRQKIDKLFDHPKFKDCLQYKQTIYKELLKKHYTIEKFINKGGFACVYEGYSLKDGIKESCAFKFIFETPSQEIQKEIEVMKSFEKPINVVKIIDSFQIGEQFILILEKCQYSLFDELKQIKEKQVIFNIEKLLQIILDLVDGLIQFRVYNILHLDIKPGNILVTKDGNYCYSDFGISHIIKQNQQIECLNFTKSFASPEQLRGEKSICYESDVFSLGRTLEKVILVFKEFNQEYSNKEGNIIQFIKDMEEIIQNNMIQNKSSDRLECQKLHELILQKFLTLNQFMLKSYFSPYQNKLKQIIDLYSYSENKDIPYILQLKLFYSKTQKFLISITSSIENIILFFQNFGTPEQKNKLKQYENTYQYFADEHQINFNQTSQNKLLDNSKIVQYIYGSVCLKTMAQCYRDNGDYKNGLKYELECLEIIKKFLSQNKIADSLDIIGSTYKKLGEKEIGLNYQIESLEIRNQIYKGNNEYISTSLNNIGQRYMDLGQYEKCLQYTTDSLKMNKQMYEGNHKLVVATLNNMAQCYYTLNDKHSCLRYQLESLLMAKVIYNGYHPQLVQVIDNLGDNYYQLNNKKKSLKYQEKSLEMKRSIFQKNHNVISQSLYDLGDLCLQLDEQEKGQQYLSEFLEIRKQIYQGNHLEISNTLNKIWILYFKTSNYERGLEYQSESLKMLKLFDKNHPNIVIFLSNLGKSYAQIDDIKSSLEYYLQSLQTAEQIFEAKNVIILDLLIDVLQIYKNIGDEKNILKYTKRVIEFRKQIGEKQTLGLAQSLIDTAQLCFNNDDKQDGIKYTLEYIEMKRYIDKGNTIEIAKRFNHLSTICSQLGDDQNSLIYQLEGLQVYKQLCHENNLDIAKMLFFVGSKYFDLNYIREALNYSLESLIMRKLLFKRYDKKCLPIIKKIASSYYYLQDNVKYLKYYFIYEQTEKQNLNVL